MPGCGFWDGFWALVRQGVTIRRAIRNVWQQSSLVIDAWQCIREVRIRKSDWSLKLPCEPDVTNGSAWIASNVWTRDAHPLSFDRILRFPVSQDVAIKKSGPISGATFQEVKFGRRCQERRWKLPLRQAVRHFGKC